ncbi:hypothetical protein GCM10018987_56120 [Streptomyces cremeus]
MRGGDPVGETRKRYAHLLDGLRAKLVTEPEEASEPEPAEAVEDGVEALAVPEPCVLCGRPAGRCINGFAQHLDPAECGSADAEPAEAPAPAPRAVARATAGGRPAATPRSRAFPGVLRRPGATRWSTSGRSGGSCEYVTNVGVAA